MNNDLISREALKKAIDELFFVDEYTVAKVIDNAPTVKPCENCDLYFKATTKEIDRWYKKKEEQKGGAE